MAKYFAKRVTVQSLVSCHQIALNYKIIEQDRLLIVTLCYKISTEYSAQLVTCLPLSQRVMSSRLFQVKIFFYINFVSRNSRPFYFIFHLLFVYFYWCKKKLLPVHEFHMQFKIIVYNASVLAQFIVCSAVNIRDMSSRPTTYRVRHHVWVLIHTL